MALSYQDYVDKLYGYKQQYNAGNKSVHSDAQQMRSQAAASGYDLNKLEQDAMSKLSGGQAMTSQQKSYANSYINAVNKPVGMNTKDQNNFNNPDNYKVHDGEKYYFGEGFSELKSDYRDSNQYVEKWNPDGTPVLPNSLNLDGRKRIGYYDIGGKNKGAVYDDIDTYTKRLGDLQIQYDNAILYGRPDQARSLMNHYNEMINNAKTAGVDMSQYGGKSMDFRPLSRMNGVDFQFYYDPTSDGTQRHEAHTDYNYKLSDEGMKRFAHLFDRDNMKLNGSSLVYLPYQIGELGYLRNLENNYKDKGNLDYVSLVKSEADRLQSKLEKQGINLNDYLDAYQYAKVGKMYDSPYYKGPNVKRVQTNPLTGEVIGQPSVSKPSDTSIPTDTKQENIMVNGVSVPKAYADAYIKKTYI